MTTTDIAATTTPESRAGEEKLVAALREGTPVVAVLGQLAGWRDVGGDPLIPVALEKAGRSGDSWTGLLAREDLPPGFYPWLSERFLHRAPSQELLAIADSSLSAVYTSSIDPGLVNLFTTGGREPEPVVVGDPLPAVQRSRRRPPIYYLFGKAGGGADDFVPPRSSASLSRRRLRHASAMLRTITETATPLGLIVVDGYDPSHDWLRAEDLLAALGAAPEGGVVWCGKEPKFQDEDAHAYEELVDRGVIVRDERSLGQLLSLWRASQGEQWQESWDEPGIVSLSDGKQLITTPRLRLATQASAAIVDDAWLAFQPPRRQEAEKSAFRAFHAVATGPIALIDGVRRGYAIERDFEADLQKRVDRAITRHHEQQGAIVLHGQSGVGKSIALGRLALGIRETRSAAVLFAHDRLIQPADVSEFLAEVDKLNAVTVVIVDASSSFARYDSLLQAFRSRGHRTVVVGSSYRVEPQHQIDKGRFVEAPAELSKSEELNLADLAERFGDVENTLPKAASQPYALARFFWQLPASRTQLSEGLGRETRLSEAALRKRGAQRKALPSIGSLGSALVEAGYEVPTEALLDETVPIGPTGDTTAGRAIDYIMAASRLYKWVPVNLLLRAILSSDLQKSTVENVDIVRELFEGQDIFRWRFADEQGEELLVGARLQIEAELICSRRLGGPNAEASRLIELINNAVRAGPEDSEETGFLIELVIALGPDGPFKERYRDSYAAVARALTNLRERHGVLNARLMLQEATLRRHHVRVHSLQPEQNAVLLDEARAVVDEAIAAIDRSGDRRVYAGRRTRENLWVERAATYGYLATDSARRGMDAQEIWSSYRAAREAAKAATGRVDSYHPLDVSLWIPARILRDSATLEPTVRYELQADIYATLELIDPAFLDPSEAHMFQEQKLRVAEVLGNSTLGEEAFEALSETGSTAGYYLRSRALAPVRPEQGELVDADALAAARNASRYLREIYDKVSSDTRCLTLLLSCEWIKATGRWLFRGLRQPLPSVPEQRVELGQIVSDLIEAASRDLPARYRYLDAVFRWLTSDELGARASFHTLAADTEYIDQGRVVIRHMIADEKGQPELFDGMIERQITDTRWSVFVERLSRNVDLIEREVDPGLTVGRTLRGFGIGFNYLGPLVDRNPTASNRR